MGGKRKRESSTIDSPKSIPDSSESRPSLDPKSTNSDHTNSEDNGGDGEGHKGPKVQYMAAEGSNSWSKSLGLECDYAKSIKHIGKKLGVPKEHAHKLKLSHVRDGGREVEILDNFDYEAFKARAVASPGSQLILKVYGVSGMTLGGTPVSEKEKKVQNGKGKAKADAKATTVEKKDTKKPTKPSPALQSPVPGNAQPSSSKPKSKPKHPNPPKPSSIPPQVGSASSPNSPTSPSPSAPESKNKPSSKKAEQKRKRDSEIPSTPSPAPSAPSSFGARPTAILNFHDRYKPARSSPLNPNRGASGPVPVPSPSTPAVAGADASAEVLKQKRARRNQAKKEAKRLRKEADEGSDSSSSGTPQATPQKEQISQSASSHTGVKTSTPQQNPQKPEQALKPPSTETKEGSVDQSPPRKRARKSINKFEKSNESSPAPASASPTPAPISTTPNVTIPQSMATSAAGPGPSAVEEITLSANTPSSKKVVRVSNENYDLKQKPKESKAVSSSITGEKKKPRRSKARGRSSMSTESGTPGPSGSTLSAAVDEAAAQSTPIPVESSSTIAEPLVVSELKAAAATDTLPPTVQPPVDRVDAPSTPANKKNKSKATPKTKSTLSVDDAPSSPAATSSSQEIPQGSSSPPPSSDTPSTAGTPSKKKKATRTKKSEPSEPGMMQQILARQRERVAAEKAAKAALEAEAAAGKAGSKADGGVVAVPVVETASGTEMPASESTTAPSTEQVATGSEPAFPVPVVEEPESGDSAAVEKVQGASKSTSSPEEPTIQKPASDQSLAIDEPAPTHVQAVNEAIPSSEDLFPSSLKSNTTNEIAPASPAEVPIDVEMREPSPDVEPAAVDAPISASPLEKDQALPETAAPAPDSAAQEPITTTADDFAVEAEPDVPQSQAQVIAPEVLVPETVIPPKATSATSSSSKGKSTKTKRKIEVPCTICLRTPWHIQKDCPEVKAGSANLRYLLTARQDQHASISTEDDESHFDSSIEAIQEWIERLEMIAGKVNGVKKDGFKARSPVKVMGNKEGLRLDLNAVEPKKGTRKSSVLPESEAVNGTTQVAETTAAPATTTTTSTILDSTQATESDSAAQSPPESRPESPMAVPDTYNFPPIHLRAMQKSRRPGSLSGLSVSDAIIETGSSDDSSSEDEVSGEDDGHDSDTSSVVSDSSDSNSDSDSDSDSDGSDSGSSRVVMPSDPSDAMKFSLTRDLSEREKKKARLSAAKMQPVTFDLESVVDDGENDNLETSPSPIKAASRSMARTGSDSSIGDFGDGDSRRSSIDSAATAPYRSQAPPVIASSALPRSPSIASDLESIEDPPEPTPNDNVPTDDDEINENTPSAIVPAEEADEDSETEAEAHVEISAGQRSRSFREMDGMAASSPDLDDSAGLEAVQQGIDEEDDNVSVNANGDSQTVSTNPVATQSLSQARRTRSSASVVPDDNVIVPASQPLRRSSRTSISATPQDLPRRLRSVSRDVVERTPPPPARSTRSRSQSQVPPSPSTPKARRASRTMVSDMEAEEETPKQTPRRTRVTRSTQPEESLPTVDESQSTQSQSQSAIERQTQSTPVRRSTRASPSPLFMTQGSQLPATQFYNANPETIAVESSSQSSSQANGRKTRTRKAASPIPEEQEEDVDKDGDVNMSPRATSPSLPPTQSETGEHPTSGQADPADQDIDMESQASSSDDEHNANADDEDDLNSIPDIQPPKPRILPPTSSQSTTPIYPSLSSLPKELLRKSWNMLSGNNPSTPVSARQALTNGHNGNGNGNGHSQMNGDDSDDSGSSSDSSVEAAQAPPSVLKGRFASGGMKKKPRSSQVSGW